MKRIFLIVLDSLGIGEAPDAKLFGDAGANTLRSAHKSGALHIPNLEKLGIGNIDGIDYLKKTDTPLAAHARLREISAGKDTTIGHWEIAGIVSKSPLPTYPGGFPDKIINEFKKQAKIGIICNKPYSGTEVIRDYGDEHMKSGKLIVYTSADSVFQIAAHEEKVPIEKLYEYCRIARKILAGEHSVGRVIARPFIGNSGKYTRTANRRDFSLVPPKDTLLNKLSSAGLDTVAVGKIEDIFAGSGITEAIHTHSNTEGMQIASELLSTDFSGLAFINLVEFDSHYGHRQDAAGYARALSDFDAWLGGFSDNMRDDDMLIITADHGCDPSDKSTDHTREYVPLLVYGKKIKPENLGTRASFTTTAKLISDMLCIDYTPEACEIIARDIISK